jgi:hypothetical protein
MAGKRAFPKAEFDRVFGQSRRFVKMLRAGLSARVSTQDQQTLPMQNRALREYAARRGWMIAIQVTLYPACRWIRRGISTAPRLRPALSTTVVCNGWVRSDSFGIK